MRISQGVRDPLSATVLLLESDGDDPAPTRVVFVSCDLISIHDDLRGTVREQARSLVPDLDPLSVILRATHTHTAPRTTGETGLLERDERNVMRPSDYMHFASRCIAKVVAKAWRNRAHGGIAFGLGHAVVGHNRLISYADGHSQMYATINRRRRIRRCAGQHSRRLAGRQGAR